MGIKNFRNSKAMILKIELLVKVEINLKCASKDLFRPLKTRQRAHTEHKQSKTKIVECYFFCLWANVFPKTA